MAVVTDLTLSLPQLDFRSEQSRSANNGTSIERDLLACSNRGYFHPYLYLNRELIAEKVLSLGEVEEAVATELVKLDGVALAVSSTAMASGKLPDTPLLRSVLNNRVAQAH